MSGTEWHLNVKIRRTRCDRRSWHTKPGNSSTILDYDHHFNNGLDECLHLNRRKPFMPFAFCPPHGKHSSHPHSEVMVGRSSGPLAEERLAGQTRDRRNFWHKPARCSKNKARCCPRRRSARPVACRSVCRIYRTPCFLDRIWFYRPALQQSRRRRRLLSILYERNQAHGNLQTD